MKNGKDVEERRRDAYTTIKKKAPNVTPRREKIIKKKGPKEYTRRVTLIIKKKGILGEFFSLSYTHPLRLSHVSVFI